MTDSLAAIMPARPAIGRAAFASVAVFDEMAGAQDVWSRLEAEAPASGYQTFQWLSAWMATIGADQGATAMVVAAFDAAGRPALLLPLCVTRAGGQNVARFMGGKDSNFNLPLARPGVEWSDGDLRALLTAARARATLKPDVFLFANQPEAWEGLRNPLAALPRQPSPSFGYKTALVADAEAFLRGKLSKEKRKKFNRKERRLAALGPVRYFEAREAVEIERLVEVFLAQKQARLAAMGIEGVFDGAAEREFILRASSPGPAALRWHALEAGKRVAATFAGVIHRGRFHGVVNSYDSSPEIAVVSPGELLLKWLVERCCRQGLATFDLGVGEAGYKDQWCETPEPLFDAMVALSLKGRARAALESARLAAKRKIKQNERLWSLARWLRARRARRA